MLKIPEKVVLATHNQGKVVELREALSPLGIEVLGAAELGLKAPEETGRTFRDNALLKANFTADATGLAALADDSGLEVEALDGAPGVDTAFYGGFEKLLKELANIHEPRRGARFRCVLALKIPGHEPLIFEGSCDGRIALAASGDGGFGYDPVFIPEGETRTFASMSKVEKYGFSHRGQAFGHFLSWLKDE